HRDVVGPGCGPHSSVARLHQQPSEGGEQDERQAHQRNPAGGAEEPEHPSAPTRRLVGGHRASSDRTYVARARASASMLCRSAIGATLLIRPCASMTKTMVECCVPPVTPYALHTAMRFVNRPVRNTQRWVMECCLDHTYTSWTEVCR